MTPIRSIPPEPTGHRTPQRTFEQQYKIKSYMPDYRRMWTGTLEKLLADAQWLEQQVLELVKVEPTDGNLEKLDRLQLSIGRLKCQIAVRTYNKRRGA